MTTTVFAKHPDLWFDDGNVVLFAENTGFRVYRGLLTRQSEIFRDMFLMPQSEATATETYEGCPVVRMAEDGAEEWVDVLRILCETNESQRFYSPFKQLPFHIVAAALRLGSKYAFHQLREEALRRLRLCWPSHWKNSHWENSLHDDNRAYGDRVTSNSHHDALYCQVEWDSSNSIAVLHLARQFGLDDLVTAALYRCANDLSIDQLFSAAADADSRLHVLTQSELRDCISAREDLFAANIKLYDVLSCLQPNPSCEHEASKSTERSSCCTTFAVMTAHAHKFMCRRHVLSTLDYWITEYNDVHCIQPDTLCRPCLEYVSGAIWRGQEEAWVSLRRKFCPAAL